MLSWRCFSCQEGKSREVIFLALGRGEYQQRYGLIGLFQTIPPIWQTWYFRHQDAEHITFRCQARAGRDASPR